MTEFNQAFTGGAVDLGEVARQAESRRELEQGGFEPFVTVDEKTIETQAFERSAQVPVVLMFGSARSADSEALKADLERLAAGQRGFMVAYVDTDASPQLAGAIGVRAVPTVVALAGGRPVTSFEGAQPADQLEAWVGNLVAQLGPQLQGLGGEPGEEAPAEDPRLDAATAALNAGDFAGARAMYDDILADPNVTPDLKANVKQAKATVAVIERFDPANRTSDPIADAEADPADVGKQFAAADAEVLAGAPERAFDRLLALVKAEPAAKERLLELFTLFEPGDARVKAARTRLASALF
ncbi:tetratricopeptide repeat protein [Corynebacterium sp. TA-R-1]|uniref:Tetratricopeptide repeat protein n=1 Tax=Corynebacterium stercoris TaxID=2943490 RepID=A0ABT1G3K4_9CORY|nr:tetratricopeptide repeat protein [Corynebacterium stercoris]MCP1387302.1 tetratricopeptide repeat protein [Corynebacterium stercoris]